MATRRRAQLRRYREVLVVSFILSYLLFRIGVFPSSSLAALFTSRPPFNKPICPVTPLLDDVFVVLRTGATEAYEKLPTHLNTTLACIPDSNYIIYSDFEEDVQGYHLYDVLDRVSSHVKETVPEFELYNQLRKKGREGLQYQTTFGSGPSGALDNPGWKLDKWKFLPMVEKALQHRPNAKWFVFIESDTYMLWGNMLEYLSRFDAGQSHYLGKHMYIGGVLFAHGGSGFALSNPAMSRLVKHWKEHEEDYEDYTQTQWAGDMILGKALKDVGIDMFWSFPHLQGDSLTTIDWNVSKVDKEPWCFAPLTFHHMNQNEFRLLWQFEQDWRRPSDRDSPRFRDIFKAIVHPKIRSKKVNWDNISTGTEYSEQALAMLSEEDRVALSPVEIEAHFSFEKCQAACEHNSHCIQFSYAEGKCVLSKELRLGHPAILQCVDYSNAAGRCTKVAEQNPDEIPTVQSGWVMSRVSDYVEELDKSCEALEGKDWVI